MFETYALIFKKVIKIEKFLLLECLIYSIAVSVYPILWTILPEILVTFAFHAETTGLFGNAVIIGFLAALALFISTYTRNDAWMRMNHVRYEVLKDILSLSLDAPYYMSGDEEFLNQLQKAKNSTMNPNIGLGAVLNSTFLLFGNIIVSLGFLKVLSKLSWTFTAFVFLSIILIYKLSQMQLKVDKEEWENVNEYTRKGEQIVDYATDERCSKDIRIFHTDYLLDKYIQKNFDSVEFEKKVFRKKKVFWQVLINAVDYVRSIGIYGWIIYEMVCGNIHIGAFMTYVIAVQQLTQSVQSLLHQQNKIVSEISKFKGWFSVKNKVQDEMGLLPEKIIEDEIDESGICIEFRDVSFTYSSSGKMVLQNFNLKISKLERVALVGVNGAGKSTLIHLICRLFKPQSGTIFVNGQDIWSIPLEEYYSWISIIFQNGSIFPFQIKENITLEEKMNIDFYDKSVEQSKMTGIIKKMPLADNTFLMHIMDSDGVEISGGEKQKLLLARALYKSAKCLIFDEPSGAMDAMAEEDLYKTYEYLAKGMTSIVVSHQLSFVRFCDRILFLENGKIVEEGTHKSLLEMGGRYAEMYLRQAKQYD